MRICRVATTLEMRMSEHLLVLRGRPSCNALSSGVAQIIGEAACEEVEAGGRMSDGRGKENIVSCWRRIFPAVSSVLALQEMSMQKSGKN